MLIVLPLCLCFVSSFYPPLPVLAHRDVLLVWVPRAVAGGHVFQQKVLLPIPGTYGLVVVHQGSLMRIQRLSFRWIESLWRYHISVLSSVAVHDQPLSVVAPTLEDPLGSCHLQVLLPKVVGVQLVLALCPGHHLLEGLVVLEWVDASLSPLVREDFRIAGGVVEPLRSVQGSLALLP